jgi:hypothetical protein
MNTLIYLIRGGGQNILINTGPPQDLTVINKAWLNFFGYPEAQIVRTEDQLPQNILRSQGLAPEDITMVLVTPSASLRYRQYSDVFKRDHRHIAPRMDRRFPGALLSSSCPTPPAHSARRESLSAK